MEELSYDAGNVRTAPVTIGGTSLVPELPQEGIIIDKLDEIAAMDDRLEAALEMFCYVAGTQVFLDGNKRVAQLMCNKIMMEDDIGVFSIPYKQIVQTRLRTFSGKKCLLLNPGYAQSHKSESECSKIESF